MTHNKPSPIVLPISTAKKQFSDYVAMKLLLKSEKRFTRRSVCGVQCVFVQSVQCYWHVDRLNFKNAVDFGPRLKSSSEL